MYLKQLQLSNFRGFRQKEFILSPNMNLFCGTNGSGKTAILDACAIVLSEIFPMLVMAGYQGKDFSYYDVPIESIAMGENQFQFQYRLPVQINGTIEVNGKDFLLIRSKNTLKGQTISLSTNETRLSLERQLLKSGNALPLISYQSAARTWNQKREELRLNEFDKIDFSRISGYDGCFSGTTDIRRLLAWCEWMEHQAWQLGFPIELYEAVKRAFSKFFKILYRKNFEIQFNKYSFELDLISETGVLPLYCLNAGHQSLIWMVMDIAYRMALLNPQLKDNITNTSGIVLIDELDTHLHPKLQHSVIDALQKTFPRIQFIITTFSSATSRQSIHFDAKRQLSGMIFDLNNRKEEN